MQLLARCCTVGIVLDYIQVVRSESARFGHLIGDSNPAAPVPSCPGWSVADLAWHLTEVQYFWATIVEGLLPDPGTVPDLDRPTDDALPRLFAEQSQRLVDALQSRDPADQCWSWHDAGHTVGWIRRRQAHEALIHRVDAEVAAGNAPAVDEALAADGVDEVLAAYLDATDLPEWATFHADGSNARLNIDGGASWVLILGSFTGTSPQSGTTYDEPALCLGNLDAVPDAELSGSAKDLDLWLWGRGPIDEIAITGRTEIAGRIRDIARAGTQ